MPKIQPLPQEVINIIAAGEVIDSFAAVVRELAENAIDAQASRLSLQISLERWQVQIADDGHGMTLADLQHCALPHSTSKIHTSEDLWRITSLGFRGEALHSIAQLAELAIRSRPAESPQAGWQMTYDRLGHVQHQETVAIAPGTIITVSELFGNVPVRRQGLPAAKQQLQEIQDIIQHLALCHPQVNWSVEIEHKSWLQILAGQTAQDILPQFLRRVQPSDLGYVEHEVSEYPDSQIQLVLGLPDRYHRHKPDWLKVAVNGRYVRSPQLEQTILAGMARTLPRHRHPVAFLHLHLPPEQIDWNRHPAKTEIYLHNLDFWRQAVSEAIAQVLNLNPSEPTAAQNQRLTQLLKAAEPGGTYRLDRTVAPTDAPKSEIGLMPLKAVAQVNQMYIVTEHPNGLWLIEQHIAHERVLFEQLQAAWEPIALEQPVIVSGLRDRQVEQLQRIGLDIDPFGEQMWAVRSLPGLLAEREDQADAILELSQGGDLQTAQVATACRSAIRNGKTLTLSEMQTLIEQWQATRNPRTCPHGRPIYLALDESSLSKFFRRHWVIGKSHGI
ncbi:MAG: DNA mismatch repair endonuclease MutL [Spirulina sp. SIO3F2]|nr:DNA mismatch repair endonuclease MutL [Spirulina sp. SIO3F2]